MFDNDDYLLSFEWDGTGHDVYDDVPHGVSMVAQHSDQLPLTKTLAHYWTLKLGAGSHLMEEAHCTRTIVNHAQEAHSLERVGALDDCYDFHDYDGCRVLVDRNWLVGLLEGNGLRGKKVECKNSLCYLYRSLKIRNKIFIKAFCWYHYVKYICVRLYWHYNKSNCIF